MSKYTLFISAFICNTDIFITFALTIDEYYLIFLILTL